MCDSQRPLHLDGGGWRVGSQDRGRREQRPVPPARPTGSLLSPLLTLACRATSSPGSARTLRIWSREIWLRVAAIEADLDIRHPRAFLLKVALTSVSAGIVSIGGGGRYSTAPLRWEQWPWSPPRTRRCRFRKSCSPCHNLSGMSLCYLDLARLTNNQIAEQLGHQSEDRRMAHDQGLGSMRRRASALGNGRIMGNPKSTG